MSKEFQKKTKYFFGKRRRNGAKLHFAKSKVLGAEFAPTRRRLRAVASELFKEEG